MSRKTDSVKTHWQANTTSGVSWQTLYQDSSGFQKWYATYANVLLVTHKCEHRSSGKLDSGKKNGHVFIIVLPSITEGLNSSKYITKGFIITASMHWRVLKAMTFLFLISVSQFHSLKVQSDKIAFVSAIFNLENQQKIFEAAAIWRLTNFGVPFQFQECCSEIHNKENAHFLRLCPEVNYWPACLNWRVTPKINVLVHPKSW